MKKYSLGLQLSMDDKSQHYCIYTFNSISFFIIQQISNNSTKTVTHTVHMYIYMTINVHHFVVLTVNTLN